MICRIWWCSSDTLRCILDTLRCILDTFRCILDTLRCILDTLRCILDTLRCILDTLRCILDTSRCILDTFRCILDIFRCILDTYRYIVDTFRCILDTFKCILESTLSMAQTNQVCRNCCIIPLTQFNGILLFLPRNAIKERQCLPGLLKATKPVDAQCAWLKFRFRTLNPTWTWVEGSGQAKETWATLATFANCGRCCLALHLLWDLGLYGRGYS